MPPIFINGRKLVKRYVGDREFIKAYVGSQQVFSGAGAWSPPSLFASGEQGAWYDPSDLSTMFQDSSGTIPVTGDGQPVGMILDKSKGGWTNLVGTWSKFDGDGVVTVVGNTVTITGATTLTRVYFVPSNVLGAAVEMDATFSSASSFVYIGATGMGSVAGRHRYTTGPNGSLTMVQIASGDVTFQVHSLRQAVGNHAKQATAASRPLYKTDGTYHWLQFDGIDDSLSTATIDFTSTDKMSAFGGVRKTRNQAAVFFETSANWNSNANALAQFIPIDANGRIDSGFYTGTGQNYRSSAASLSVPASYVTSLVCDTAGTTLADEVPVFRINAVQQSSIIGPGDGSGNFIAYPLYIGARGGSSIYFSGNVYSLIIRGALSTADEITATETWINGKTGAY